MALGPESEKIPTCREICCLKQERSTEDVLREVQLVMHL